MLNIALMLSAVVAVSAQSIPYSDCTPEFLPSPLQGTISRVEVNGCTPSDTSCPLIRGTHHTITIYFTPTEASPTLERAINAILTTASNRKIEIPFGGNVDACPTTQDDNGETCANGLVANQNYVHNATLFIVNNSPTTDLHVRYMLRAASPKDAIRRGGRRNRRPHPGPYFACIEIPVSVKAPATESP